MKVPEYTIRCTYPDGQVWLGSGQTSGDTQDPRDTRPMNNVLADVMKNVADLVFPRVKHDVIDRDAAIAEYLKEHPEEKP